MLGNFTFYNPTKLYFGENSLDNLSKELGKYGEKVMLVYGSGSIRKNGIYDEVLAELRKAGKQTVELSGVMPNPTIEKVMEGVALARKEAVDFILAVGGGSSIDTAKAVAHGAANPVATIARRWQAPRTANMTRGSIISIISGK